MTERTIVGQMISMYEEMKEMRNLISEVIETLKMSDKPKHEKSDKFYEISGTYPTNHFEYLKDYRERIAYKLFVCMSTVYNVIEVLGDFEDLQNELDIVLTLFNSETVEQVKSQMHEEE